MSYYSEVLADAPVDFWKLDNDLTDAGSAARALTATGISYVPGINSLANTAAQFTGTGKAYTTTTAAVGGVPLTIECSFKINTMPAVDQTLLFNNFGFRFAIAGANNTRFAWGYGTDWRQQYTDSTITWKTGTWYHMVFLIGGGNGFQVYRNGTLVLSYSDFADDTVIINGTAKPFVIGNNQAASEGFTGGVIDNVAIYNNVRLSTARITAHANAALPYNTAVMADSPATYWHLDSDGTDSIGTRTLTPTGGVLTGQPGALGGGAWTFDGIDDKASTPTMAGASGANQTFEVWVKSASVNGWTNQSPTFIRRDGTDSFVMRGVKSANGTNPGNVECSVAGTTFYSSARIDDGAWHHVVLTLAGTAATLYVDGSQSATATTSKSTYNFGTGNENTYVGGTATAGEYMQGSLDEIALYNTALSGTRILAHYNAAGFVSATNGGFTAAAMTASVAMTDAVVDANLKNIAVTDDIFTNSLDASNAQNGLSIKIGNGGVNGQNTGWYKFPTVALSAGQVLSKVYLYISAPAGTVTFGVHRADVAWTETSANDAQAKTLIGNQTVTVSGGMAKIDITSLYQSWLTGTTNYGLALTTTSSAFLSDSTENGGATVPRVEAIQAAVASRDYSVDPITADVSMFATTVIASKSAGFTATAMTASVATVSPIVSAGIPAGFDASPFGISLLVVDATATAGQNASFTATAFSASLTMPTATVAAEIRPDVSISVQAIEEIMLFPGGVGTGGMNANETAAAFGLSVSMTDASVSNQTDKDLPVGPMTLNTKLVGIYTKENDRWYKYITSKGFHDSQYGSDAWFQFDETSGTTAVNHSGTAPDGVYYGNPTLGIDGMGLRKAVHFDGVNDYLALPELSAADPLMPYYYPRDEGWSVEMVMRTTTNSGTIFSDLHGSSALEVTETGLRLAVWQDLDNTSNFDNREFFYDIPAKVNDGEWHQIFAMKQGGSGFLVMVDGKVVWNRKVMSNYFSNFSMPWFIGTRPASFVNTGTNATGSTIVPVPPRWLNADIMGLIIRNGEAYSVDEARRSYYELMDHTVVEAGAAADAGTVSMPQGVLAKGNAKRMLLLWGNAVSRNPAQGTTGGYGTSPWSGMVTDDGDEGQINLYGGYGRPGWTGPKEYDARGYRVIPVNIFDPRLAPPGIVKDNLDGYFTDDETGETRYIDINKDLNIDVRSFDVIHVLNWPEPNLTDDFAYSDYFPTYGSMMADQFYYDQAREKFKNSIRAAVDKGVGLWIAQAQMALEFGITKSFDVHSSLASTAGYSEKLDDINFPAGPATLPYDGYTGDGIGSVSGAYIANNGLIMRRIVSTAPNFSEFPTWFISELSRWTGTDRLRAHADSWAHNVTHLDGLSVGTEFPLEAAGYSQDYIKRDDHTIYSLRTEGLVGQVIAKEQLSIPTVDGEILNPYADNAVTVLIDRGTILEGRPVGGRIFVELMDNGAFTPPFRHIDAVRNYLNGTPTDYANASHWDFDSRRNKELFYWGSYTFMRKNMMQITEQTPLIDGSDVPAEQLPHFGMNDRGLAWLGVEADMNDGEARVYAAVTESNVSMPTPTVSVVKNTVIAPAPMTAKVVFTKPQGIADPDATVFADPMNVEVKLGGYQRVITVTPMEISVSMSNNHSVRGEGEDIIFILRDEDVTLYLGEDS